MILGIHVSHANHKQRTGVEWYTVRLIEQLKTMIPENVTVRLYSDAPLVDDLAELPPNWESRVLRWPPRRLWTQIRLSWEMLIHPPNVLFVPAHVPPLIRPKKTVMTVHDIAARSFGHSYSRFERWYTMWSARRAVTRLWKVIVPSTWTKDELVEAFEPDDISKICVVPHGYDAAYAEQDERRIAHVRERYGITKPYLFSLGRLEQKKNTARIIEAFDELREKGNDLQLVLVGKPGYGYEAVRAAKERSAFAADIIEPGWVEGADLPALYAGAEVFVFPSLAEGFGIPVLESMATGTPVVAAEGTCLEEVGGEAALYADPFDATDIAEKIEQLLSDRDVRDAAIEKGFGQGEQYSWERTARETLEVLSLE